MRGEAPWRVRDFHADDLDAAVRLWDNPAASSEAPAFGLSDLISAVRSHEPAVVAVAGNGHGEELAGIAVATVSGAATRPGCTESSACSRARARSAPWPWSTPGTPPALAWSSTSGSSRSVRAAPGCSASSAAG